MRTFEISSVLISACETGAEREKAIELLASMAHVTVEANDISYNVAISACKKGVEWEKAIELVASMAH
eukprot:6966604-Prorocentrum_lima.AAC.1